MTDRVGGSGLAIAAIRAQESARPDRLFADPLAGAFVAAAGWSPPGRPDGRADALKIWVVARTVFLDELLAAAGRDGCRQVVLLGAGLDARAFRLPWPAGVRCFELDGAEVLEHKALVLTAQAAQAGCERIPVTCDLRADWSAALLAAGFDPGQPAAWIAEGLLVYLTPADADGILADLTALSAPGSRLGLTMSSAGPAAGGGQARARAATARHRSAVPDDPVRWLAGHGWSAQVTDPLEVLRAHGRAVPGQPGQPGQPGDPESGPPEQRRPRARLVSAVRDPSPPPHPPPPPLPRPRPRPLPPPPRQGSVTGQLPLSALLSQVLVGFTIEFDNEFEHQMPHRTTRGPAAHSRRGPWLVSQVMWANFMRFVSEQGVSVGTLRALAGVPKEAIDSQLTRMEKWWGYVVVEPDPADTRPKPPRRDWLVRPTPAGRRARQVWEPLAGVIEERWRQRFGTDEIGGLRESLQPLVSQLGAELPHYLPVGATTVTPIVDRVAAGADGSIAPPPDLSVLLSQLLLAFTIDFERESALPLAVSANALRVLTEQGARVRDLPRLTGVSKEAISVSLGFLQERGCVVVEPDPADSRVKLARLTREGEQAQGRYRWLLGVIEERWQERFGADDIRRLRGSLRGLLGQDAGQQSRFAQGLVPYPDGWRAHQPYLTQTADMIADPGTALPHYPVVSHRGGFPDGS